MSAYAAITALIFAIVALAHIVRIINRWAVQIGSLSVSMSVSWAGFVVAGLLMTPSTPPTEHQRPGLLPQYKLECEQT